MSLLSLPDQTIPESQKDKEWHMQHALDFASFSVSDSYNDQRREMLKLYRGYNAELSEEELALTKAITCPHGIDLGVEYVVYPLIQSKIEQIVGEYMTRPMRRKTYLLDKKSKNEKYEKKLTMLSEQLMREIAEESEKDLGFTPQTENPEMELPNDIEEFFEKDFKDVAEEVADGLLNIFLDVRKEKQKFKQLFTDYCITDRAHAILDKKNGFTTMRKVHTLDAEYDLDPYKVVQDNHQFFFENYYLTELEIYNTFPELTDKQKAKVKMMFEAIHNTDSTTHESQELTYSQKYNGWFQTNNKIHRMRCVFAMWRSHKKVPIKASKDKNNNTHYKKLSEDYKARNKDVIENIIGDMPRHVTMLGPELCLSWGLMEERFSFTENPFECTLPVVSIVRDNTVGTSLIKSPAAKLYQLQQIASEVLFEIRLALKTAGNSKVLVYDAAQTPKEFTKQGFTRGLNRVMHHIKKDQMMIINSKEKGFKNNFNQFTSLDLSQKGAIQDLFNGLAIIEDLASKFVGISPEREGQIGQYQTATGTDKAIRGSFARTEVIYTPFDEFVQAVLEKVLLRAKFDYEKGEVLQYIIGKYKTKFLTLFDKFFSSDIGLYLSDARKDHEAAQRIDAAAEMALSNANTPEMVMGLIEVFEGESAEEKKAVFQRLLNSMEKLRQEAIQREQEAMKQQAEADKRKDDIDLLKSREGNQTEENVANIYVQGKAISDTLKNTSAERQKAAELALKEKEMSEKNKK